MGIHEQTHLVLAEGDNKLKPEPKIVPHGVICPV